MSGVNLFNKEKKYPVAVTIATGYNNNLIYSHGHYTVKYYEPIAKTPFAPELLDRPYSGERFYAGYLSPSGRVSISVLPRPKISRQDKDYESTVPIETGYLEYIVDTVDNTATVATEYYSKNSSLGLSSGSNHHTDTKPQRYGLKGISANGRKKVREGCYLLERKYGRRLGFYTLTCPYTDEREIYEFNRNIAEIARRYFQKLKRYYDDVGQTWSYVSVYEYQPERYAVTSIPVLHIHYVAPCYKRSSYEWICEAETLRDFYASVLQSVIGGSPNVASALDATVVRSSAVGYVSKYMSKGGEIVENIAQIAPSQIPSQWWSMSSNIRAAIKRCTVVIPESICAYLFSGGGESRSEILYLYRRRYIEIFAGRHFETGEERYIRVGMSAQLCRDGMFAMQTWNICDVPI